ncbi:MAG TPA: hypothetical protein VL863_01485 [bacterium]|jgi:hypothetical protein|nr:hypothetical protein [bacterium]
MRLKLQFLNAGLFALLVSGCVSNDEPIVFVSAPTIPASVTQSTPAIIGLSTEEEQKVDLIVFGYLLDRHLWEDGDCTALFVQADDVVVDALIKKYPTHVPPIKQSSQIDLRSSQSPLDKDTGKPAMILGADVGDLKPDGSLDVTGRWYAGGEMQGRLTFSLKKTGADWTIVSVK